MNSPETFKIWLKNIYVSEHTGRNLTSGDHYARGLIRFNKLLNLPDEGIFSDNVDFENIRYLIDTKYWHKNLSSYFNAYLKFREYNIERQGNKSPIFRQTNVLKRQEVEFAAINAIIRHFEKLNYIVISKEKDNLGWDLEASNTMHTLYLEVKGLSGKSLVIELSPNEYEKSKLEKNQYRICIVSNALIKPIIDIFSFNGKVWINENGNTLFLEERVGARLRIE